MQVRGEILVRASEHMVLKSAEHRGIVILLGKNTNLAPASKISDRIEAVASDNLHPVKSLKRRRSGLYAGKKGRCAVVARGNEIRD